MDVKKRKLETDDIVGDLGEIHLFLNKINVYITQLKFY